MRSSPGGSSCCPAQQDSLATSLSKVCAASSSPSTVVRYGIAHKAGHHDAFIRTRASLAFLFPKIQRAICDGTLPPELTLHRILQRPIPLDRQGTPFPGR